MTVNWILGHKLQHFKLTIGTKKISPKENRHKTPRITWLSNSLHPRATTNKFHYIKFGIIQIGVEALSQTQIPKIYKYQIWTAHKLKRESQSKSKSCNTPRKSISPSRRTKTKWLQTSLTIPNCNPQISNNQMKREPFSHTHSHLFLSNFL